jgi:hypothetical protein
VKMKMKEKEKNRQETRDNDGLNDFDQKKPRSCSRTLRTAFCLLQVPIFRRHLIGLFRHMEPSISLHCTFLLH